jgi:hypothetical protein
MGNHPSHEVLLTPVTLFQAIAARSSQELFEPLVRLAEQNPDPLQRGMRVTSFLLSMEVRALPLLPLMLQAATYRPQAIRRPEPVRPYVIDTKMPLPLKLDISTLILPADPNLDDKARLRSNFIALAAARGQAPQLFTLQTPEPVAMIDAALRVGVAINHGATRHGTLAPYVAT